VQHLEHLQQRTREKSEEIAELERQTVRRRDALQKQKQERQIVLQRIETALNEQRGHAKQLAADETRLGNLIRDIEAEIARQAELARKAEEERLAEARRQAEQAREAALARQKALEQEQERARAAEQAAREAREQAE